MTTKKYQDARIACEIAKTILSVHDFKALVHACDTADAVGPILDPTAYREKGRAMHEDREVFRAAIGYLKAWPDEEES